MNIYRLKLLLIFLAGIAMAGCLTLKELLSPPELEFDRLDLTALTLFEVTPVFKFKATNPNPIEIPIRNVAYNLTINKRKFIKGMSEQSIRLKAGGSSLLEMPFTLQYLDLFDSLTDFFRTDQVDYELSGAVDVAGVFTIPYHLTGQLPIPKLPDVAIRKVDFGKPSPKGVAVTLTLDITNPNAFPIFLNALHYEIKLGDTPLAQGVSQTIPEIGKNGKTTLKLPLHFSAPDFIPSLRQLAAKSTTPYTISGAMKFDVPSLGLTDFNFENSGQTTLK